MKLSRSILLFAAIISFVLLGCQEATETPAQSTSELCDQAVEHVQNCFPDREFSQTDQCTEESARNALDKSCEELEADNSKSDHYCAYSWWTCNSSDSDDGDSDDSYGRLKERDIWVTVRTCNSNTCDSVSGGFACSKVTIEDNQGNVVASGHAGSHNGYRSSGVFFEDVDLGAGTYTVKLYRRDGQLGTIMVEDGPYDYGRSARSEAEVELEIERYEREYNVRMYVPHEQRDEYQRCARLQGTVSSTCNGEPMSDEETEWSWLIQFTGEAEDGAYVKITRPFSIRGENRFGAMLLPGDYDITFYEMDIPSYKRENNPDYEGLLRYYDTGHSFDESVTVNDSAMTETVDLGRYELDHQDCR